MRTVQPFIWVSAFLLLLSLPGQAAQWSAAPEVRLRGGYNDNIRLDSESSDTVFESALTPSVKFGVTSANKGLFGKASASIRRFTGGSGRTSSSSLDREDYQFNTDAYHQTLRNTYRGILNFTRDSTLDSELDQTGQVISTRATRSRITLGPSWTGRLTEKTQLNLGYSFTTVSYTDDPGEQDLVEYDNEQFSVSLTHQYTSRLQATLATSFSSYQPDTGFDSDTINIQAGLSRRFSETLSTSWLAGYRETTSDTQIATGFCIGADPDAKFPACQGGTPVQTGSSKDDSTNTGSVFSANITKSLLKGRLSARLSRSTNPSGSGELLDTTRLSLAGVYRFSSRLETDLLVTYSNAETISRVSNTTAKTDRNFTRIRPSITWRWRKSLNLSASYEYSESENTSSQTARSNAFFLILRYRPTTISISR